MKRYYCLISLAAVLILIMGIGSISANENLTDDVIAADNDMDLPVASLENDVDENTLSADSQDAIPVSSAGGKTITIEADPVNPNQVLKPTVQPAIDAANPGDTIILKGNFVHCHFTINKTLNIIAAEGAILGPCPHHTHEGIDEFGVFYILEGGSGSVISGFTFLNGNSAETPFSFLISGASNVVIKDCTMNLTNPDVDKYSGITIENSNNVKLVNLFVNNTINGINIINSSNIDITNSIISDGENNAINIIGNSKNINILNNEILNNGKAGINLSVVNNVVINNNQIRNNGLSNDDTGSGIYVNTNVTKLVVKGNIFISNGLHAIMYDYRARNLNNEKGADLLTDIDNNYFEAHSSMMIHHRIYVERSYGDLKYDAENDVYGSVGEGNYVESKSYVYMKHALINNDVPCGFTYYTTEIPWTLEAPANNGKYDLSLELALKQIKNGLYQISIVDKDGNVATDFNSIHIPVFLNGHSTVKPQSSDIYRNVLIKNGVGTADFRSVYDSFKLSGNVLTAVFLGISERVNNNCHAQLKIKDSDVPINPSTKLTASKLTTYPLSDKYLSVKLLNSKGKPISGQKITFKFNAKTYTFKTNSKGIAKVKVSLSTKKTYGVTVTYSGSDDYKSSKTTTKILVKAGSKKSKITSSNMKIKKNTKKTYKLKLTTSAGKALKSQKVVVKVNGKSYTVKTNSKGIAKLSIKLPKVKKYKVTMKFLGNANYKASSKTSTITVTKK